MVGMKDVAAFRQIKTGYMFFANALSLFVAVIGLWCKT